MNNLVGPLRYELTERDRATAIYTLGYAVEDLLDYIDMLDEQQREHLRRKCDRVRTKMGELFYAPDRVGVQR